MTDNVLARIEAEKSKFSKSQKLLAAYILENYDKAAFMTAGKLGKISGVSESTVVRFAAELGYKGYPHMQKALQELIRSKLTSLQRINVTNDQFREKDIVRAVLNSDVEKIRSTLEELSAETFESAVDKIISAERIYILATRSASPLAAFMAYYLNLIFDNVRLVNTNSAAEIFEEMLGIKENDLAIGFSFPRYSTRTIKAMQFAEDKGADIIAITDSRSSPLASIAGCTLYASSGMISFLDSLVAPLSLVNALVLAVGMKKKNEVLNTFEYLEQIWDEYGVYDKRSTT